MSRKDAYNAESVLCPYYDYGTAQSLTCEGPTPGSKVRLSFASRMDKSAYKAGYCDDWTYKNCRYARAAAAKYGE